MATTEAEPTVDIRSGDPNEAGYRPFELGEFKFRRDDYFVYIEWPTGSHVMSADAFLKALQRDVAWDFFYGIVNFDGVIGTVNHYGTVDLFAGRYNDGYRKEADHLENMPTPTIRETFKAMLDDWTNETFDPFASPDETGSAFGPKNGDNRKAITRHRVAAARMVGVKGDEQIRSDDSGFPVNRHFTDVPRTSRRSGPRRASRTSWPPSTCSPTCRAPTSPGTRRSSRSARTACSAPPPRSTSCRSSTATTGWSGSCSCRTRSTGTWRTATPARSAPRWS